MKQYIVYILCNRPHGAIYIGITSNLAGRLWQHREKLMEGFTKKYGMAQLVYYEIHDHPESAIIREKQLKRWKREWKIELIEKKNPGWADLTKQVA